MGVMLHPNKKDPQRYRVQFKSLDVNEYFSFTKYGAEEAKRLACERNNELERKLKARKLIAGLGISKLFASDGSVKGLSRKWRERVDRKSYECFALYANKMQTEIVLKGNNFESAYHAAQEWLLDRQDVESTFEIRLMFKEAKRQYWQSVRLN